MDQQKSVELHTKNPTPMSGREADEIRALLRLPPLLFYGELENTARERCGKVIAKAKRGRKFRWII